MPTVHLIVKGRVQGVFYRASAREKAEALGVTGWVKNSPAGDVELRATGSSEQLEQLIAWCRRGPEQAIVTEVVAAPLPEESFAHFRIAR